MTSIATQPDVAAVLIGRWREANQKLTVLADAIPEAQFAFRPVDGVRSPADILRHVAFWNRYVAETVRGGSPDGSANELPKNAFKGKAELLAALSDSAAEGADALSAAGAALGGEMAGTIVSFLEHTSEHYGQLAVYARLKGIVPPASRG